MSGGPQLKFGKTPRDMHLKASAQLNEKGMSHNPVQYHVEKIPEKSVSP